MDNGTKELSDEARRKISNETWRRQRKQMEDIRKKFETCSYSNKETIVANLSKEPGGDITHIITVAPTFTPGFSGVTQIYKLYTVRKDNTVEFTGRKSTDPLVLEGLALKRRIDI